MKYKDITKCKGYDMPERVLTEEAVKQMSNNTLSLDRSISWQCVKRMDLAFAHPDSILGFMPHDYPNPEERYRIRKANLDLLDAEIAKRKEEGRWY